MKRVLIASTVLFCLGGPAFADGHLAQEKKQVVQGRPTITSG